MYIVLKEGRRRYLDLTCKSQGIITDQPSVLLLSIAVQVNLHQYQRLHPKNELCRPAPAEGSSRPNREYSRKKEELKAPSVLLVKGRLLAPIFGSLRLFIWRSQVHKVGMLPRGQRPGQGTEGQVRSVTKSETRPRGFSVIRYRMVQCPSEWRNCEDFKGHVVEPGRVQSCDCTTRDRGSVFPISQPRPLLNVLPSTFLI